MKHFIGGFCIGFPVAVILSARAEVKVTKANILAVLVVWTAIGCTFGGAAWGLLP